ncbi:Aquaporin NIP2-1 [Musa troglodytarum]|uniref:Aquaporin NIP2-1 n=1 Tax=Musa troglodytarum TaxID=320322 RepID=A0A9E7KU90_9LILI|nr:Aquaporin NIP2-1 [Musa troglodytarum]
MASSHVRPSSSNEIHDIDIVTAQTLTTPSSFDPPRVHRRRNLKELFPPFLPRKVVSEMIATFLLVFVTCGAGALNKNNPAVVSQLGASVAGGLIVTVMIYAVGHISGAHMNPAVTLAFAVARHFPWIQVPFYMLAQIAGSTIASYILRELLDPLKDLGTTTPSHTAAKALVAEIVVTFNMMPISGGSMNPARTLGPALASNKFDSLWVYFVGPPLGTVAGALAYSVIRLDKHSSSSQKGSQKSPSLKMRRVQSQDMESPTNDAFETGV